MNDFITLACPSCGAALSVSTSAASLKCDYCGHEHLVRKKTAEKFHSSSLMFGHALNVVLQLPLEPVFARSAGSLSHGTAQNVNIASMPTLFFVQNVESILGTQNNKFL